MPAAAQDYRNFAFDLSRLDASGKSVGRDPYRKLYSAENIVRVIINSVLVAQLGPTWWTAATSPDMQKQVTRLRQRYAAHPWHGSPGRHEIYFTFLSDLVEIMRANANLFLPVMPDVDAWIARMEQVLIPRNVIGHMNWPTKTDRDRISVFLQDLKALVALLPARGVGLQIP